MLLFHGVQLLKHGREEGFVDRKYPHLTGSVFDRDTHVFTARRLVKDFDIAYLVRAQAGVIL
jgi:hypothetical protein